MTLDTNPLILESYTIQLRALKETLINLNKNPKDPRLKTFSNSDKR